MESDMGIYGNRKIKLNLKLGWVFLVNIGILLAIASSSSAQSTTSLNTNFRVDPTKLTGDGGGSYSLANIAKIAGNCRGYANNENTPNHTITLNEPFLFLDFLVNSTNNNDDPTMLIKGPDGITICADDESKGRFPQVRLSLPNGLLPKGNYQVWVGSKTANQSFAYTLYLSEKAQ
jgi:hypothetical protein